MNQTFTSLDLVRFLYCETSQSEDKAIAVALESDATLNEEFRMMQSAHRELSDLTICPGSACINSILKFSAQKTCDEFVV
jgi:hypothetical protein